MSNSSQHYASHADSSTHLNTFWQNNFVRVTGAKGCKITGNKCLTIKDMFMNPGSSKDETRLKSIASRSCRPAPDPYYFIKYLKNFYRKITTLKTAKIDNYFYFNFLFLRIYDFCKHGLREGPLFSIATCAFLINETTTKP